MIHMLQCLCGPARHAIYGVMYDDEKMSPQAAREGIESLIEMMIGLQMMNRRCEICDKPIKDFWYEDSVTKEQEWGRAVVEAKESEIKQTLSRELIQATRKAGKN